MKETFKRAIRTFFQAAIGYIAANLTMGLSGAVEGAMSLKSALTALIAAAVSCGLAAVMNLPKKNASAEAAEVSGEPSGAVDDDMDGMLSDEESTTAGQNNADVGDDVDSLTDNSIEESFSEEGN